MRSFKVFALVAAVILVAGILAPTGAVGAEGGCTTAPESQWLSIDQLKAKVAAQGFVVWKGRIENGCAEIAAYPSDTGALDRLRVDPSSGQIVDGR